MNIYIYVYLNIYIYKYVYIYIYIYNIWYIIYNTYIYIYQFGWICRCCNLLTPQKGDFFPDVCGSSGGIHPCVGCDMGGSRNGGTPRWMVWKGKTLWKYGWFGANPHLWKTPHRIFPHVWRDMMVIRRRFSTFWSVCKLEAMAHLVWWFSHHWWQ